MRFLSWLDTFRPISSRRRTNRGQPHRPSRKPVGCKLAVEALEDRCLPSFLGPVSYAVDAVATADFNIDGSLDLAGFFNYDYDYNSVSVLLGNVDGTFQPGLISAPGDRPRSLAVGDFNADGKLDIATTNSLDVSVLLGHGDGTFQAPASISPGLVPAMVVVGDFNADHKLDLAVTSKYVYAEAQKVSVLLGKGDGSFSAPRTSELGFSQHLTAAVADFNGDGRQDFATVNYDYETVSVLLSDVSGTLQAPTEFSAGTAVAVAAGDIDGDGDTDLVTANAFGDSVSVLLGDGLGAFGDPQFYAAGNWSQSDSVVLGDFNSDRNLDIATVSPGSYPVYGGAVIVLLGNGDGTFQPAQEHTTGSGGGNKVVAGDFNGDGWLDAVTGGTVLINDQSWPPSVSISGAEVTEGNAGTVSATFTLSLSFGYDQAITVHFATADDSATAGSDYIATSGDVTFAPGETSKTTSVAVLGDRVGEGYEGFLVNLSGAIIGNGTGYGSIVDDEPRLSINNAMGMEGNTGTTPFTFTVTLSAAYDAPVSVNFATSDYTATVTGGDYQAISGTLTIPAGQTSGTITVPVNGDRLGEGVYYGVESFYLKLASPNAFTAGAQGVGTILDDEPRINISDVTKAEGQTSQTTLFTFTVKLSVAYDQAVTMSFQTVNGTARANQGDYIARIGTLTFAPGETSKTITIEVKGDNKKEAYETFYLDLFGNSSNSLFTKNRGMGTILNDD